MTKAATGPGYLTPVLTIAIAFAAALAWWWAPALLASTPLADLGFAINLVAVLAVLFVADWLTERSVHRD